MEPRALVLTAKWEPGIAPPISCLQAIGAFSYVRVDPSNRDGALPPIEAALDRRGRHVREHYHFWPKSTPNRDLAYIFEPNLLGRFAYKLGPRVNAQVTRVAMGFRSPRRQGSFALTGGM